MPEYSHENLWLDKLPSLDVRRKNEKRNHPLRDPRDHPRDHLLDRQLHRQLSLPQHHLSGPLNSEKR